MVIMLLEWIFTSAFLILVVLALRAALGKRMSAGLRYGLWAVVLVRLLVPVQLFTSPIAGTWVVTEKRTEHSVVQRPGASAAPAGEAVGLPVADKTPGAVPVLPDPPSLPDAPEPPAAPDLTHAPAWLGWVWLAGSAAVAVILLLSNLRFYRRLRQERVPLDEADLPLRAYTAAGLPSPCLFGIIRPAVYVTPDGLADPAMLRHVLAHEYTHYRHGDHIWSLLRCAALAVHWWNPLVWLAAFLSQRDGELACDEGALKRLGDGERAAYGNTLLALVTAKPGPADLFRCATTMAGDKKSLKERISRIAQAPKRVLWAVVVAVAVTALACVCAFGQAEPEPEDGLPTVSATGSRTELTFSLVEWARGSDAVKMKGTVEGFVLEEEASWIPPGDWSTRGELDIIIPLEDCDRRLYVSAEWKDDGRTSVEIAVEHVGTKDGSAFVTTVTFTATRSEEGWTVTDMEGRLPKLSDDRPEREITDEEALLLARIAATLLTEAEKYYNSGDGVDWPAHFPSNWKDVPAQVLNTISRDVRGKYEQFLFDLDSQPIAVGNSGRPEFDDWRVKTLDGPWTATALGMDVEIWRGFSEYHTPEPEKAEYMLAGGMYVTEDGWFSPEDWRNYYIFSLEPDGWRLAAIMPMGAGGGAPDGETQEMRDSFDAMVERALADTRAVDPSGLTPDLNRNGIPEELRLTSIDGGAGEKLEVWENGKLLYEEEGYHAHVGYNALFLYRHESRDYLLRYHPTMYQGYCTYNYQLFTLEHGKENLIREDSVEFDINFQPLMHQSFDVNEIVRFMNGINELLSHSVQLLNTDGDLLDTFEKNGRLYDDLGWLDNWEPVYVRGEKALPDELWRFKTAMEGQCFEEEPVLYQMNETEDGVGVWLLYQNRKAWFVADYWEYDFQPAEQVNVQVVDLNYDGRDEIVFPLVWGHGTGALVEKLYVFDAETLEQYDTDQLNEMILGSIQSTGDEDNFYLQGPGMPGVTLNKHAPRDNPDAPVADAIGLGDVIQYTVSDGVVYCWLGCDMSGALIGYEGYLKVWLEFTDEGSFECWRCDYVGSIEP